MSDFNGSILSEICFNDFVSGIIHVLLSLTLTNLDLAFATIFHYAQIFQVNSIVTRRSF